MPRFVGKKGSPGERLHALRRAYLKQQLAPSQTDCSLLTPLEHDFYQLAFELEKGCTDPILKQHAKVALEDARRVADRAMVRRRKKYEAHMARPVKTSRTHKTGVPPA